MSICFITEINIDETCETKIDQNKKGIEKINQNLVV